VRKPRCLQGWKSKRSIRRVPDYRLEKVNRQNQDGSLRYLNFVVLPLRDPKNGEGLLLVVEDITQFSQLEQQLVQDRNELRLAQSELSMANASLEQLNHLKSLFLSIAAHDLRSPLTAISGYTDLILSSQPHSTLQENREYLNAIRSLVGKMDRLIRDFLDLDSIDRGAFTLWPMPCDLNELIRQVTDSLMAETKHHGLSLSVKLRSDLPRVEADPDRVQQILYNLLNNAIKYTPAGGQIQVSSGSSPGYAVFEVQDNGCGIPESSVDQLFDLYYRTEQSRKSQVRGKGLGLFIVKSLVDAHQGKIVVNNSTEGGAIFTVYLPTSLE